MNYTLADGREFPESSPLVKFEKEVISDHIKTMRHIGTQGWRDYLQAVERKDGKRFADRLKQEYLLDHAKRATA